MIMTRRIHFFWATAASIGVLVARVPSAPTLGPQDTKLHGITLIDCDIDVRPAGRTPSTDKVVNVYYADSATTPREVVFTLVVPTGIALELGGYTGANPLPLPAGTHTVTWSLNVQAQLVVVLGGTTHTIPTSHFGTPDPVGPLVKPTLTEVRSDSANKARARLQFSSHGISSGFTLSYIPPA